MSDFLEEDFYKATPDGDRFAASDGYGHKALEGFGTEREARDAATALNIAFARGAMRAFSVVFTPDQLAEAGVV